jgi:hypothetical protein
VRKKRLDVGSSLPCSRCTDAINASRRAASATVCSTVQIPTITATSIALRY